MILSRLVITQPCHLPIMQKMCIHWIYLGAEIWQTMQWVLLWIAAYLWGCLKFLDALRYTYLSMIKLSLIFAVRSQYRKKVDNVLWKDFYIESSIFADYRRFSEWSLKSGDQDHWFEDVSGLATCQSPWQSTMCSALFLGLFINLTWLGNSCLLLDVPCMFLSYELNIGAFCRFFFKLIFGLEPLEMQMHSWVVSCH